MFKLVNEIVELLRTKSQIDKRSVAGAIEILLTILIGLVSIALLRALFYPEGFDNTPMSIIANIGLYLTALWMIFHALHGLAFIILPLIKYGLPPRFKNRENSIERYFTNEVGDKGRMHKSIIQYLSNHSKKDQYAALFQWLKNNQLINCTQTDFNSAIKEDLPEIKIEDTQLSKGKKKNKESANDENTLYYQDQFEYLYRDYLIREKKNEQIVVKIPMANNGKNKAKTKQELDINPEP